VVPFLLNQTFLFLLFNKNLNSLNGRVFCSIELSYYEEKPMNPRVRFFFLPSFVFADHVMGALKCTPRGDYRHSFRIFLTAPRCKQGLPAIKLLFLVLFPCCPAILYLSFTEQFSSAVFAFHPTALSLMPPPR